MESMQALCPWESPDLLIFSSNVPTLLYYSHFIAILAAGIFALVLLPRLRESLPIKLFFTLIVFFSAWAAIDVLLWASNRPDIVLFQLSFQILLEMLLYASAVYFVYTFVLGRDMAFIWKCLLIVLLLPIIILLPTSYLLPGIDIAYCDAAETPLVIFYTYGYELLLSVAILFIGFHGIHTIRNRRKEIGLFITGIVIFLLAFSSGNIVGSITEDWSIAQAGLFGMPIFIGFLAYTAVKFKSFNIKLFGAQAIVIGLWLLTLSQLFIRTIENIRWIVIVNLILFTVLGYQLVKSVKREIEQREHIEILAKDLEVSNKQQVTLIHFITHQIKGFLTKSRNIFAGMREGDYGVMPDSMQEIVRMGFESDTKGVDTIQEILGAANIKSGKVTYKMQPFDLKQLIDEIVGNLKTAANAKKLALTQTVDDGDFTINGDRGQLVNVFKNLLDNSIKYTLSGTIAVSLAHAADKVVFKIEDTGVGITPQDMEKLFTEGGHGAESLKVNTESTGFGLYIVKNIVEAHKGRVWAESEGAGKGSRFIVELPTK